MTPQEITQLADSIFGRLDKYARDEIQRRAMTSDPLEFITLAREINPGMVRFGYWLGQIDYLDILEEQFQEFARRVKPDIEDIAPGREIASMDQVIAGRDSDGSLYGICEGKPCGGLDAAITAIFDQHFTSTSLSEIWGIHGIPAAFSIRDAPARGKKP